MDRVADPLQHPGRDLAGVLDVADLVEQHRELVATQAARRVLGADRVGDAPGDLDQEAVALAVPQRVVHGLEVIEIQEQDRRHVALASPPAERMADAIREQGSIGETRERIVEGLVAELFLERGALGHVVGIHHEARH